MTVYVLINDTNISADVIDVRWRLGMEAPFDPISAPSKATVTVMNTSRLYSPESIGARVQVGDLLRIADTVEGILYTGWVREIEPQTGDQGTLQAHIHASGPETELQDRIVTAPLMVNVRTSEVVHSVLGVVPLTRYTLTADVGVTILPYAGDTWWGGVPAMRAIREAVEAEGGRFISTHGGSLTFLNRYHLARNRTVQATFTDSASSLTLTSGRNLANQIRVEVRPRTLGNDGDPVWRLFSPQRVPAGISEFVARFRSESGLPMGALSVYVPVAGTDYTVNTLSNGTGANVTAQVTLSLISISGGAARVRVNNTTGANAYLLAGAKLRGTPLISGDEQLIEVTDTQSMIDYGAAALSRSLPLIESVAAALEIAHFELSRRKTPRTLAHQLSIDLYAHPAALGLTLFDVIRVIDTHTAHDGIYRIIAEAHEVTHGGAAHRITFTLEPDDARQLWVVGVSGLETSTRLAY